MRFNSAFDEMMVHIPLCTHKIASEVLVIGTINEALKKETFKHTKTSNIEFNNLDFLKSYNKKNIDVIILTDVKLDEILLENIYTILKDDGLFVFPTKSFSKDKEQLISDLKLVGEKFWIAMPFKFGHTTSIIASKKYHPTADLNLQRADLLDDLGYYSSEIHTASFVFPASEHKALTGIAKR